MRRRVMMLWSCSVALGAFGAGCLEPDARPLEEFVAEFEAREGQHPDAGAVVDVGTSREDVGVQRDSGAEALCSPANSTTQINVVFASQSSAALDVFWVDWDCLPRPYGQIAPRGEHAQSSYVGHVWQFRVAGTTTVVEEVSLEAGMDVVNVGASQ